MYDTILVAIDGSSVTDTVLNCALKTAKAWNAELHGVHVIESGWSEGDIARELAIEALEEEANALISDIREKSLAADMPISMHIQRGHPGNEIVNLAEEIGADLIIVGARGKSQVQRILIGSVSEFVVTHSPVTTTVVRE